MMPYALIEDPPIPMMQGEIFNPVLNISEKEQAKLDTGSALTVIPEELVSRLKLMPKGTTWVKDFRGNEQEHRTYVVHIMLDGEKFEWVEIISRERPNVLVGRNVLNNTKLILDGKNLVFKMEDP